MKNLHFLTSRTTPLDPTGRQKHVQTIVQVVYYQKNTGCMTKDALGVGFAQKLKLSKNHTFYMSRIAPLYPTES